MKTIQKRIFIFFYLLIQISLYVTAIFLKTNLSIKYLEYSFIIINFISSVILTIFIKTSDSRLVSYALFFTLLADTFLLMINKYFTLAVTIFIITQIMYYLRLIDFRKIKKIIALDYVRLMLIIIMVVLSFIVLKERNDLLVVVTMIYFVNLIMNFFESIKYRSISSLFMVGLLLFIFCDIFVGLWKIDNYIDIVENTLLYKIINLDFNTAWFFYFPSQILLLLSIFEVERKKKCLKKSSIG